MAIQNGYFNWICDLIDQNDYVNLFTTLFDIPFYWSEPLDENMVLGGLRLRKIYSDFMGVNNVLDGLECSVLEAILALSVSIEDNLMCDRKLGDRSSMWFMMMIHNLGLDVFRDGTWSVDDRKKVENIVLKWMSRDFEPDGSGGLFPLDRPLSDQRKISFWYQMNAYMGEKYGVGKL